MNKSKYFYLLLLNLFALNITDAICEELKPITVTATRTSQTIDETPASVTVITRKQIEHQQARSVTDVLTGLAGINISNNGGAGTVSSLFLRGASVRFSSISYLKCSNHLRVSRDEDVLPFIIFQPAGINL